MNKAKLRDSIGTVVRLNPRPKVGGVYLPQKRNRWLIVEETKDKNGLLLKNRITGHELPLPFQSVHEFRDPDVFVLLRADVLLHDDGTAPVEPVVDAPDEDASEEPVAYVMERFELAETQLQGLTEAEKAGLRQLLVQEKMTDTDLSQFLVQKGHGPYRDFYSKVSAKCSFLDREYSGYNTIIPAFRPVLRKLLPGHELSMS